MASNAEVPLRFHCRQTCIRTSAGSKDINCNHKRFLSNQGKYWRKPFPEVKCKDNTTKKKLWTSMKKIM